MTVRVDELVGPDWVDGRVYTDQEIFQLELARIFRRTWLYVAHDSEVPVPGDYVGREVAGTPVIVARDRDGGIGVMLNRCRHRGNLVCQYPRGNSQFFRCQFHGWTYANDGALVGVPYPDRYGADFDKRELGLAHLPAVDSYRGFIFASFTPDVPPLREHLGAAAALVDVFVDQSPAGSIQVRSGVQRAEYRGNWKFVGMDGYHSNFVHRSVKAMQAPRSGDGSALDESDPDANLTVRKIGNPDKVGNRTYDYGNGHVRLDSSPQRFAAAESILGQLRSSEPGRAYLDSMEARHGPQEAARLICISDPHLGIFPNLQLIGVHIRVIEPVAADRTIVTQYPATLDGVPEEINVQRLRRYEWFYTPAAFGSPDDYEIFERNQLGLAAQTSPSVVLSRGAGKEQRFEDGAAVGSYSDEVTQRGQLARWAELMSAGALE